MNPRIPARLRRLAAMAILPLSIIPFLWLVPTIFASHDRFDREHNSGPLPAPLVGLSAGEKGAYAPFKPVDGQIPVLAYHGVNEHRDGFSVNPRALSRHLALLHHLGYRSITMAQYADWRAGKPVELPSRPMLITFDDGRLDSYRGADKVLQRFGMHATMFPVTERIESKDPFYLTWAELHRMEDSGRWDVEPHGHAADSKVVTDAHGTTAPFLTGLRYTRSGGQETLAAWEQRVSSDVFAVNERFRAQGMTTHAYSIPFGDYGQKSATDPQIQVLLTDLLERQFGTLFVQREGNDPAFTKPGHGVAERFEMHTDTTLGALYGWVQRNGEDTTSAAAAPAVKAATDSAKRGSQDRRAGAHKARGTADRTARTHRSKR